MTSRVLTGDRAGRRATGIGFAFPPLPDKGGMLQ